MKANIGNAVLPAAVHAARNLDFDVVVVNQIGKFVFHYFFQLARNAVAARDGQVASVCPWASCDVRGGIKTWFGQAQFVQFFVQSGQVFGFYKTQQIALIDRYPNVIGGVFFDNDRQSPRRIRRHIAQQDPQLHAKITFLLLFKNVGF